jgi:general secretion pathway protein G
MKPPRVCKKGFQPCSVAAGAQTRTHSSIQNLKSKIQNQAGFTLIEIILVMVIMSVLTAAAVPMIRNSVKREREIELRLALRQLRQAIDRYKEYSERYPNAIPIDLKTTTGYPKELLILEEGFIPANTVGTTGNKVKFLRRIPHNPLVDHYGRDVESHADDWGLRSYKDEPDSTSWSGEDIFDVYTEVNGTALNGTKYKDW